MRNFKKVVLALIILLLLEWGFIFLLEPVSYEHYLDMDIDRMEKAGEEPQLIFAGDSRVYRTFVPSIFEENMQEVDCVLNIGTGSQSMGGTYFYLKDMLKRYQPSYVVVGIDHIWFVEDAEYITQGELTVIDRIQSPVIKTQAAVSLLEKRDYPYLLRSYRSREQRYDILQNLRDKTDPSTRKGIDTREPEHYEYRGYVHTSTGFDEGNVGIHQEQAVQWSGSAVSREAFEYLDKIAALCREKDIQLFLVTAPTSLSMIYSIADYEGFVSCFKEYAKNNDLIYQDLNLIRQREELLPDAFMYDADHVNGKGAESVSSLYCEILRKNINGEDTAGYFYASAADMKQEITDIVACDFHTEEQEDGAFTMIADSLQSEKITPVYEFLLSGDGGNTWECLQEYSRQNSCMIPADKLEETVLLRVNVKNEKNHGEYEAFMQKEKNIHMK